jgi:calnexin
MYFAKWGGEGDECGPLLDNINRTGHLFPSYFASSSNASANPQPTSLNAPFVEQFQQQIPQSRWTVSRATKQTPVGDEIFSYVGAWGIEEPDVYPGIKGDTGLVLSM